MPYDIMTSPEVKTLLTGHKYLSLSDLVNPNDTIEVTLSHHTDPPPASPPPQAWRLHFCVKATNPGTLVKVTFKDGGTVKDTASYEAYVGEDCSTDLFYAYNTELPYDPQGPMIPAGWTFLIELVSGGPLSFMMRATPELTT